MSKPCRKCGSTARYNGNGRCIPCNREGSRRWTQANPEYIRRWMQANPERVCYYRQTNLENTRQWKRANPERTKEHNRHRRARKAKVPSLTYNFKTICAHYNNICLACGKPETPGDKMTKLTPDHIKPISKGGSDTPDNIQPLCLRCNIKKGNHHQTDYRPDNGAPLPKQLSFDNLIDNFPEDEE